MKAMRLIHIHRSASYQLRSERASNQMSAVERACVASTVEQAIELAVRANEQLCVNFVCFLPTVDCTMDAEIDMTQSRSGPDSK